MSKMICKCEEEFSGLNSQTKIYTAATLDSYGRRVPIPNSIKTESWEKVLDWIDENQGKYNKRLFPIRFNVSEIYYNEKPELSSGSNKSTGRYRVIKGIFKGNIFNGHEVVISGEKRIWDDDSVGRSYPIENTEIINNSFSGRLVNPELAKQSSCRKVESVRYFKKGIAGQLNKDQIENYCFEKE